MHAKLIFNPAAGNPGQSAVQLLDLLRQLQSVNIQAEVLIVEPDLRLDAVARSAVNAGIKLVIVSGGDGTIENVALGLVGSSTTLGIIPTGTRNNLARSLGIPTASLADAVALLRNGRRVDIDVGLLRHGRTSRLFLEAGAIGLASALYPSADDIQHGDLGKIAEFVSTFVSAVPSEIRLRIGHHRREIVANAHLVLIANMPSIGANFQIAPDVMYDDRQLDVFIYADLSKRDLIGQAMLPPSSVPDERIQRYRVKKISIRANPAMSVMADGVSLGVSDSPVTAALLPLRLRVMAGQTSVAAAPPSLPVARPAVNSAPKAQIQN